MDETAFKELISGQRRGLLPALQRAGLSALSCCYGLAVRLRNFAFDVGLKKTHRAAVPVISVGNITAGGTGKTPFVAFLTDWFNSRGVKVALLSRGYRPFSQTPGADAVGSPDDTTNDEKLVLDQLCPGVPHLQQRDRVNAAKIAVAEHGAQLLILDDGFQHRRLGRDLDIVLIDALNPFGYGRLLPRGLLREPLSGLRRADLIVLTRADQCADAEKLRILDLVRRHAPDCEIIEVAFRLDGLVNSTGDTATLASLTDKPVVAFCGIGNPESFLRTLAACDVREFRVFPDHHHYSETDVEEIAAIAGRHEAAAVVATLKDLVKIDQRKINAIPLWAVRISTDVLSGADILAARLARFAPVKNPASLER
ncbi:MAG: tetraacyldisaccharide 4'-kinase [Planctomycetes bacterium]|nr:tetraacyldisaccharide 4'-kinase [Planctomycetota bacterium]